MALQVADRVWEYTSTTGTGTLTLAGAVPGYQSFAAIGNGNQTYYTILNGSIWEVGIGTYTSSGTTLSRDTVLSNSSGNTSPITLVGSSSVFCDYPAEKAVIVDASGNTYAPNIGGTTPAAGTFTTITGQTEVLRTTGNNLFARSQTFNVYWTSGGANITATDNAVTAPDSTTTAANIVPTVTNGLHRISNPTTLTLYAGVTYTSSIYAKANGYRYLFVNNTSAIAASSVFDLQAGTVSTTTGSATITSAGSGWYRCTVTGIAPSTGIPGFYWQINSTYATSDQSFAGDGTSSIYFWGGQLEIGSSATTYVPTTTTGIWNVPSLSFASTAASQIGLQSDGSLYVSPAGTGALQAQATTSSTVGGNARGANAVDWQMSRSSASQVSSGANSVLTGGRRNTSSGQDAFIGSGFQNTASGGAQATIAGGANNTNSAGNAGFIGSGNGNLVSGDYSSVVGGYNNTTAGVYNFIGGGYSNAGTASAAVTTQSATMNGTTAVTLSGSNASIKVGQLITGTSITYFPQTYVAAISGTSLTLSQAASGSSTSTLSFYTPHGVVVGGGNNQATGSYSFIGGGGDAGTAANRNVASGDWSFVGGGRGNTASGSSAVVVGGGVFSGINSIYPNTASGVASCVLGGLSNSATGSYSTTLGGLANLASGVASVAAGENATTRGISGYYAYGGCDGAINYNSGTSQTGLLTLARQTTDATATVLTSNASAASGTNQVILPNNSAYTFKGTLIANVTGGGDTSSWEFRGCIKRGANAAATSLVGTPKIDNIGYDAGATLWSFTLTADTTNGGLAVTVTGLASTTIRWVAKIETTEVTY